MQFCTLNRGVVLSVLVILVIFTIANFQSGSDRYAYSQAPKINSTKNAADSKVDLINIRPSPLRLRATNTFEILSTVINNSPSTITFAAGRCDSPLSAHFARNVLVKHTQGCTATSPQFKLNSGASVLMAGPSSGIVYQAMAAGQIPATAIFHYQTGNGHAANVTKPFAFTIS
ncbi:MAG TPA: hypothetical protein VH500_22110 [Nitrososphaeraceae archaeon]|jgi:hypothetical protein